MENDQSLRETIPAISIEDLQNNIRDSLSNLNGEIKEMTETKFPISSTTVNAVLENVEAVENKKKKIEKKIKGVTGGIKEAFDKATSEDITKQMNKINEAVTENLKKTLDVYPSSIELSDLSIPSITIPPPFASQQPSALFLQQQQPQQQTDSTDTKLFSPRTSTSPKQPSSPRVGSVLRNGISNAMSSSSGGVGNGIIYPPHSWDKKHEDFLYTLHIYTNELITLYHHEYIKNERKLCQFRTPQIILSSLTGFLSISNTGYFPEYYAKYVSLICGVLNLALSVTATIEGFKKINEKTNMSQTTFISLRQLSDDISYVLTLPIEHRENSGVDTVRGFYERFESIMKHSITLKEYSNNLLELEKYNDMINFKTLKNEIIASSSQKQKSFSIKPKMTKNSTNNDEKKMEEP